MCQRGEKGQENVSYFTKNDIMQSSPISPVSQIEPYPNAYSDLLQGKNVSTQSKLFNLTLIFNENLNKVGGRFQSA